MEIGISMKFTSSSQNLGFVAFNGDLWNEIDWIDLRKIIIPLKILEVVSQISYFSSKISYTLWLMRMQVSGYGLDTLLVMWGTCMWKIVHLM